MLNTKRCLEQGDAFYQLAYKCEHDDKNLEEAFDLYGKAIDQYSEAERFYSNVFKAEAEEQVLDGRAFGTELEILKKNVYASIGMGRCAGFLAYGC